MFCFVVSCAMLLPLCCGSATSSPLQRGNDLSWVAAETAFYSRSHHSINCGREPARAAGAIRATSAY
uniref:Putative secreted protein n=1 Tax=Anopheles marajoara TaxID=58244 RepID=A0A2M4CFL4_9DIPT